MIVISDTTPINYLVLIGQIDVLVSMLQRLSLRGQHDQTAVSSVALVMLWYQPFAYCRAG